MGHRIHDSSYNKFILPITLLIRNTESIPVDKYILMKKKYVLSNIK